MSCSFVFSGRPLPPRRRGRKLVPYVLVCIILRNLATHSSVVYSRNPTRPPSSRYIYFSLFLSFFR